MVLHGDGPGSRASIRARATNAPAPARHSLATPEFRGHDEPTDPVVQARRHQRLGIVMTSCRTHPRHVGLHRTANIVPGHDGFRRVTDDQPRDGKPEDSHQRPARNGRLAARNTRYHPSSSRSHKGSRPACLNVRSRIEFSSVRKSHRTPIRPRSSCAESDPFPRARAIAAASGHFQLSESVSGGGSGRRVGGAHRQSISTNSCNAPKMTTSQPIAQPFRDIFLLSGGSSSGTQESWSGISLFFVMDACAGDDDGTPTFSISF
jgi:hypothetical protein